MVESSKGFDQETVHFIVTSNRENSMFSGILTESTYLSQNIPDRFRVGDMTHGKMQVLCMKLSSDVVKLLRKLFEIN